ncbi:MAG: hypothetical protein ROR55_16035 [Devosia sp.]
MTVPVASQEAANSLALFADAVGRAFTPDDFGGVELSFENFAQTPGTVVARVHRDGKVAFPLRPQLSTAGF